MPDIFAELSADIHLISLQFDFNNGQIIPDYLPELPRQTIQEARDRRSRNAQNQASYNLLSDKLQALKKVDVSNLPKELMRSGYILVGAHWQKRPDKKKQRDYYMARFIFVRKEHERKDDPQSQSFAPLRGQNLMFLTELCMLAFWDKFRAYRNPYFEQKVEIPGEHALSFNFDARVPLYDLWSRLPIQNKSHFVGIGSQLAIAS